MFKKLPLLFCNSHVSVKSDCRVEQALVMASNYTVNDIMLKK